MRRSARTQTRATGLPYSGDKYITGEMRERFCAKPADTGNKRAKRRRTLGDGGFSVRNPTLGDADPSFGERSMNHPLKCRRLVRESRLAQRTALRRACATRVFKPHSPTFTGIKQRFSKNASIKSAWISYISTSGLRAGSGSQSIHSQSPPGTREMEYRHAMP